MMLLVAVIFMMFVFALVGMDQYMGTMDVCMTEDSLMDTGTKCVFDSQCWPGDVTYPTTCLYVFSVFPDNRCRAHCLSTVVERTAFQPLSFNRCRAHCLSTTVFQPL